MKVLLRGLLLLAILLLLCLLPSPAPTSDAFAESAPLPTVTQAPTTLAALLPDDSAGPQPDPSSYLPNDTGYQDASLSIKIAQIRQYDTNIVVAQITVRDASQLRTAMAGSFGSTRNIPGAKLAQRYNAVFAVNGDYFNFFNTGYLIRQGKLYRDNLTEGSDVLLIDNHGDFHAIQDATEDKIAAFTGTVVNSFSFGPALVVDGKAQPITKNNHIASDDTTQRMIIAQTGPLAYLCVATEGPENEGSETAYNLDGGGSSTMVLNNRKINALSTHKVRDICDILYFATLVTPAE